MTADFRPVRDVYGYFAPYDNMEGNVSEYYARSSLLRIERYDF